MRTIRVRQLLERDSVFVSGYGARSVIVECGGRPMWSRLHRAWMTNRRIGADVIARAEADGWNVEFSVIGGGSE